MAILGQHRWLGSTSDIYEFEPGKVLKVPRLLSNPNEDEDYRNKLTLEKFEVERVVYEVLGEHKLVLPYYECREVEGRQGLLLAQADGNVQDYLEDKFATAPVTMETRKRWCCQAAEAIAYIHDRGVMHSDLRPANLLVHGRDHQDIWLADFNGAVCEARGLDGGQLPDAGFWNLSNVTTLGSDIFALGSVLYAIQTGWFPFCRPGETDRLDRQDIIRYDEQTTKKFGAGDFPDLSALWAGDIILGCWKDKYKSAADVKRDLESAM